MRAQKKVNKLINSIPVSLNHLELVYFSCSYNVANCFLQTPFFSTPTKLQTKNSENKAIIR